MFKKINDTHCFWVQLVSGYGQNLVHASLIKKRDKPKTSVNKQTTCFYFHEPQETRAQ